ncbi:replication initiation protein [Clostridium estertheticum]|uniref:Replication initiation protein n=1 Tax=Clostridium estertheticum TaxID=238834 RepID=A0A7Y3T012_9CLOT|nr:replication initiation protein [Clostridium estertheticum]MBW9173992.1 replication initiation protein [Clostridium estertheticum]NNU78533.1 replication initiation protein [Clostridium estertheticum]WBL49608.1 replication initiation protein [Clostridium estertheticum]WLC77830.1 replication initiation protein [Clostridium estertheticum]
MIANLSKVNNNWVYQSNKLIEASHSFSVLEQKLIRVLASMIKKDDIELKEYQFKATDLSEILGIHQKNIYKELDTVTDKLMARVVKRKNDTDKKFKKFHLIKIAEFENGILTLKIDEEVKEFYLELKQYTKYQLKNILRFKNSYSFRVYELLKQYEKIRFRELSIKDLRTILDIEENQYPKYANLKQKVINVAMKEINLNTDIFFDFKEIKVNRKVTSIKFAIKSKTVTKGNDEIAATEESLQENNDIKIVKEIIKENILDHEAKKIFKIANGDITKIKEKYKIVSQLNNVDNIVGAVLSALKEDWTSTQGNSRHGSFNDYEQRSYDFDKLEKKLLGWDKND